MHTLCHITLHVHMHTSGCFNPTLTMTIALTQRRHDNITCRTVEFQSKRPFTIGHGICNVSIQLLCCGGVD